jgi:putative ABC transport system permease protein
MRRVLETILLGIRNVGRNRRRSLITGVMIALGVTVIIFFRAYLLGYHALSLVGAIDRRVGAFQLQPRGYLESQDIAPLDLSLPEGPAIERLLRAASPGDIKDVAPRLQFEGMISNGETSAAFSGVGVDPAREDGACSLGPGARSIQVVSVGAGLASGGALQSRDEEFAIVAFQLATSMGLKVGDSITLQVRTREGSQEAVDLTVRGIYKHNYPLFDRRQVVIPLGVAQRLVHMPGRTTVFVAGVHTRERIDAAAAMVRRVVAGTEADGDVQTWGALAPYHRDLIKLEDGILHFIMLVIFTLVIAGVVNTMMMAVFERKREIGTLMAIGHRRRGILALFVIEAGALSAGASAVGAALGVGLVSWVHRTGLMYTVPGVGGVFSRPSLDVNYLWVAISASIVSALVAALYPAYRASRLSPVTALRTD